MSNPMNNPWSQMIETMLEQSRKVSETFNPALETFRVKGFEDMIPTLNRDFMELVWGKTMNHDGLDAKTRLLVTLTALTVLGAQAEPQIRLTVRHALQAGASQREVAETICQTGLFGGLPAMQKALEIAQSVFAEIEEKKE